MESRRQRRISKSAAVYIPVGALIIVVLTLLGISSFLRIMAIEVQGATRYSAEDVVSVSGISHGDNLLFLNMEAAERRIVTAMPFVSEAIISRIMPDTIKIEIVESIPAAFIELRGEFFIINSTGRVLERTETSPAGLVEIRGITPVEATPGAQLRVEGGAETNAQHMRYVLATFEREGILDEVSHLDVTNFAQINFGFQGRFNVLVGNRDNLRQKLANLQNAIAGINEEFGEDATGQINVRNHTERPRFFPDE